MSMCHKAYALNYEAFAIELAPILYRALQTGRADELTALIDANHPSLTFPWEAAPLPADWRSVLERGDPHELGDLALTKYYATAEDYGLQEHWLPAGQNLPQRLRACLLGEPFGPTNNLFDPGRMGSYFQSAAVAAQSRRWLVGRTESELERFVELLEQVVQSNQGLYVTF